MAPNDSDYKNDDKMTNNDDKDNDDDDNNNNNEAIRGGGQTTLLQVADTGTRHSRSRSLIRRGSKPKQKRGNESLSRNDCVIS